MFRLLILFLVALALNFDYGLSDYAEEKGNTGTRIVIDMIANGEADQDVLTITENRWTTNHWSPNAT